jgi:hypothetical protein
MEIAMAKRLALVDISGMWRGVYSYPGLPQPEHFVAHLSDIGGKFDGTVTETVRLTRPAPVDVRARVRGSHVAGQVRFAKTYDGTAGWTHSVNYAGYLNADSTEIAGDWVLQSMRGAFLMVRDRPNGAEAERVTAIGLGGKAC